MPRSLFWSDPRVKPPFGAAEIDWGHPLANGCVLGWLFNENAGAQLIDMTGIHAGAITGNPVWVPTQIGVGLKFDRSDDAVATPHVSDIDLGAGGVASWTALCRLRFDLLSQYRMIFTKSLDNGGVSNAAEFRVDIGGVLALIQDGGGTVVSSTVVPTANIVYSVGVTRSPTATAIFLDGKQDATGAAGTFTRTTRPLYLGRRDDSASANLLDGNIVSFHLYNRVLSAGDILWAHAEPYAMLRPIVRRRYFVPAAAAADDIGASYHLVGSLGRESYGLGPVRSR